MTREWMTSKERAQPGEQNEWWLFAAENESLCAAISNFNRWCCQNPHTKELFARAPERGQNSVLLERWPALFRNVWPAHAYYRPSEWRVGRFFTVKTMLRYNISKKLRNHFLICEIVSQKMRASVLITNVLATANVLLIQSDVPLPSKTWYVATLIS